MFRFSLSIFFVLAAFAPVASAAAAAPSPLDRAKTLYNQTDYTAVIDLLNRVPDKTAETWCLLGQARFMTGENKRAAEMFEKAVAIEPQNSVYMHWLGRAYGRQAESASFFSAPGLAVKTRQAFEKSVALDPSNKEALNDLFEFYMDAPGFLGGGLTRAEQLIPQIAHTDEAEGYFARAQLARKRKDFNSAEQMLRRAMELAPRQVGRVLDLAKFLARAGRVSESDQVFAQASKLAPDSPQVLYDRAAFYIEQKRNLDQAAALLERYLKSPLTPDNVPREKAIELLKQAKGG
jgi:tetratricopeptide (TPR) repeat protein